MKDLKEIVAKNITELRQSAKLTQLELGNAISYSDKAVSKWERGESVPDAYVLLKLADIFGVTVDYILKDHGEGITVKVKKRINYTSIFSLIVIAVWTVFSIAFLCTHLSGHSYPLLFVYSTVITLILAVVFNSLWGNKRYNLLLVSALVVSIIATLYFIFLFAGHNLWQVLLLALPATGIVICCFKVKIPTFLRTKNKR